MSTVYGVGNIRNIFKEKLKMEDFVIDKTGVKTVEIMNASFFANEPAIFGTVNEDYVRRELEWYKSQSLNVNDIPGGPPEIWKMVASSTGRINSNYGWCIYSFENGDQFTKVVDELSVNPDSRRAVMIYTRPNMHYQYNTGGMSDFMCTNTVQYMIRNNKLHAMVYMRSNDAVFGYKNDYAWQKHVLLEVWEYLRHAFSKFDDLGLGDIYWNVASLHVYERHFKFIDGSD
jgi:thymidylate synthase